MVVYTFISVDLSESSRPDSSEPEHHQGVASAAQSLHFPFSHRSIRVFKGSLSACSDRMSAESAKALSSATKRDVDELGRENLQKLTEDVNRGAQKYLDSAVKHDFEVYQHLPYEAASTAFWKPHSLSCKVIVEGLLRDAELQSNSSTWDSHGIKLSTVVALGDALEYFVLL